MVRNIVKDTELLTQQSERFEFGKDDYLIQDMIDTAKYHKTNCVGLAAPQIGERKRVIVVLTNTGFVAMVNPQIFWKDISSRYTTAESCLSVDGEHTVKRFRKIKVNYTTAQGAQKTQLFEGFLAQIIQHEIDHLNGILI